MATSAVASGHISLQCRVVQEILEDGCCPMHLRLQLSRSLAAASASGIAATPAEMPSGLVGPAGVDGRCAAAIAACLAHEDALSLRAVGAGPLCGVMQRPVWSEGCEVEEEAEDEEEEVEGRSVCASNGLEEASGATAAEARLRRNPASLSEVHNRIRVRLWLRRLDQATADSPDEGIFEASVRSFVDGAMRRRLEAEVAAAKASMEGEVRIAKANMLRCVEAISEEVDRRVTEKVTALQEEFDRRATEQAALLRDLVERRVSEQTAALRAEVDRRTDHVKAAVESRARAQEDVTERLQEEVHRIREALSARVSEQEDIAARLHQELVGLRSNFAELATVRDGLQLRVADQEAVANRLHAEIQTLRTAAAKAAAAAACREERGDAAVRRRGHLGCGAGCSWSSLSALLRGGTGRSQEAVAGGA